MTKNRRAQEIFRSPSS